MNLACHILIYATSHFAILCNDCHVHIFTLYFFFHIVHPWSIKSPHYLTSYAVFHLCHFLPTIYNYFVT